MDPSVMRAMARWPNVPEVFGWLSLDRRGIWRLRGTPFKHRNSIAFINRNYDHDEAGRWYFQNGPQRVFVRLDYTPMIWSLQGEKLRSHTGKVAQTITGVWLDEEANCLLETDLGIGLMIDEDLATLSGFFRLPNGNIPEEERLTAAIESVSAGAENQLNLLLGDSTFAVQPIQSAGVPDRFGFIANPQPNT